MAPLGRRKFYLSLYLIFWTFFEAVRGGEGGGWKMRRGRSVCGRGTGGMEGMRKGEMEEERVK